MAKGPRFRWRRPILARFAAAWALPVLAVALLTASVAPEVVTILVAVAVATACFLVAAGWLALTLRARRHLWTFPLECALPGVLFSGWLWWTALQALHAQELQTGGGTRCGLPLLGAMMASVLLGGGGFAAGAALLLTAERRPAP